LVGDIVEDHEQLGELTATIPELRGALEDAAAESEDGDEDDE
jgi:hypothetical protein